MKTLILNPNPRFLEEFFSCSHANQEVLATTYIGGQNKKPNYKTFYNCPDCGARMIPRPSTPEEIQRYERRLREPICNHLSA